jgi:hypothetical protein
MELPGLRFLRREGSGGLANEVGRWPIFLLPVIEMRQDLQMLKRIVAATVEAMGYELVGMEFHPAPATRCCEFISTAKTESLWMTASGSAIN